MDCAARDGQDFVRDAAACSKAADGRELVVMSSMGSGVTAYDPATGKIEWQVLEQDLPDRCVSSPIVAAGLVIVSCGSGNNGMHLIALRPGENGEPPQEVYRLRQGVPNIPTPVVAGDLLFLWHDRGTVACLDAATGEQHWREPRGRAFSQFAGADRGSHLRAFEEWRSGGDRGRQGVRVARPQRARRHLPGDAGGGGWADCISDGVVADLLGRSGERVVLVRRSAWATSR